MNETYVTGETLVGEVVSRYPEAIEILLSIGMHFGDGVAIRKCAAQNNVTMLTSLDTVRMLLDVLEEMTMKISVINA